MWLLLIAAVATPAIAAVLIDPADYERNVLLPPIPSDATTTVGERFEDGTQPATLQLQWADGRSVAWADTTGLVTAIEPFGVTVDGQPLMRVDGQIIAAQVSGVPVYRELRQGDAGPDVTWLDQMLRSRGVTTTTTLDSLGRLTRRSTAAIEQWQVLAAAPVHDGIFRPDSTLYLGQVNPSRLQWLVAVGDRLSPGMAVAKEAPSLTSASFELSGDDRRHSLVRDSPIRFEFADGTVQLDGLVPDADDLATLADALEPATPGVDGSVSRQTPLHFGAVPSSSLVGSGPTQCVVVVDSPTAQRTVAISVPAGASVEPGISYVQTDLVGAEVLLDPGRRFAGASC